VDDVEAHPAEEGLGAEELGLGLPREADDDVGGETELGDDRPGGPDLAG
jgi:hypothetical protein